MKKNKTSNIQANANIMAAIDAKADTAPTPESSDYINFEPDPEVAYAKSMDYLDKVLAETALTAKNLRSYQIGCFVLSLMLGGLLAWNFGNVFGLIAPIVGMNITFYLYSRGVSGRLKQTEANAAYDKDRLRQGKLDPRGFYGHIAEALTEAKRTDYLNNLSGDVSMLSPKEKARLSKYRENGANS